MTLLRLATFNVFSGRSLEDGLVDPARLSDAVQQLDADVLAVQEVDRHQPRSGSVDQAALIAEAAGAVAHRYVATVHGTPGEPGWEPAPGVGPRARAENPPPDAAMRRVRRRRAEVIAAADEGPAAPEEVDGVEDAGYRRVTREYGIGLVSRVPVESWHVLYLPPARGRYPMPLPPGAPKRMLWLADEPRAAVAAVLTHPRITVASTHLSFVPGANVSQLRRVRRWLVRLPGPHLLLGDLNLPGDLPARLTGWCPLAGGPTFPSPEPRIQIDHVLASSPMAVTRTDLPRLPLGDHRAVVVDVDLDSAH